MVRRFVWRPAAAVALVLAALLGVARAYSQPPAPHQSHAPDYAAATDHWVPAGRLVHPRQTLVLVDGRPIAVGGYGDARRSAETLDLATGEWSIVARLSTQRYGHTATALRDGRVLVVGGATVADVTSPSYPTPTPLDPPDLDTTVAELIDPATGRSWPTGALTQGKRWGHVAALLPDGQVLVAGGCRSMASCPTETELYDPGTGTWHRGPDLSSPRYLASAAVLADGRVLVIGGMATWTDKPDELVGQASAEIYDPATARWTPTAPLVRPRVLGGAARLDDGRVLIVGMEVIDDPEAPVANAEIYDPVADRWTPTAPLAGLVNYDVTATLLPSGRVLAAGGAWRGYEGEPAIVQLYDPATGTWSAGPPLLDEFMPRRMFPAAVRLRDGRVLLVAAYNAEMFVEAGLQLTDTPTPAPTDTETPVPSVTLTPSDTPSPSVTPTASPTATDTITPTITLTPSITPTRTPSLSPTPSATPTVTPPAYGFWTDTAPMHEARAQHSATLLQDGEVLVTGGHRESMTDGRWSGCEAVTSAEIFDPARNQWRLAAAPPTSRDSASALLLPDGRVLVIGGFTACGGRRVQDVLHSAEVYDPRSDRWTVLEVDTPDLGTTYVVLNSGQVLLSGFFTPAYACTVQSSAHTLLLDPDTGATWPGPSMNRDRASHFGIPMPDGRVLLGAGVSMRGTPGWRGICSAGAFGITEVDILDQQTGTVSRVAPVPDYRLSLSPPRGVALGDGRVLIAGWDLDIAYDTNTNTSRRNTWWLFDPRSNRWDPLESPLAPRDSPALVQLANGLVLFVGGDGSEGQARIVDLYDPGDRAWLWGASPAGNWDTRGGTLTALGDGRILFVTVNWPHGGPYTALSSVYTFSTPVTPSNGVFLPAAFTR